MRLRSGRSSLGQGVDRVGDDGDGLVHVLFGDDQRRNHADDILADGGDQQLAVEAAVLDIDGVDGAVEFDADEQALATGLLDVRQLGKLVDEVCADLLGIARQVAVDDFGDGGERGCAAISIITAASRTPRRTCSSTAIP